MASDDKPATPAAKASASRDIAARMAALTQTDTPARPARPARRALRAVDPETASDPEPRQAATTARATPSARKRPSATPRDAGKGSRRGRAMPAEQPRPPALYSERLSITTTTAQIQALRAARVADGIEVTARLRAMIALWQDDPKLRARVDKAAQDWQF